MGNIRNEAFEAVYALLKHAKFCVTEQNLKAEVFKHVFRRFNGYVTL